MTAVPWSTVIAAAQAAAPLLPQPAGAVVSIAAAIARVLVEAGCSVEGCVADVELQPADAPDLLTDALDQRMRLTRLATGTDRASVDAALRSDADELDRASER